MSTNQVADGHIIDVTAAANTNSGQFLLVGSMYGVAQNKALTGETVSLRIGGVWTLPKTNAASNAFTVGAKVYWDNTNAKVTPSATSNTMIGVAVLAAANTDATARVRINGSFA